MNKNKPVIGITVSHGDGSLRLGCGCEKAIVAAGGLPLLLPIHIEPEDAQALLALCDGVLFSGGVDVDPVLYGEEVLEALNHGQVKGGTARTFQKSHAEDGEEPHHQAVKALGAGENLENEGLTELGRILGEEACAGFTGNAGTAGGACTCEAGCETCAQKANC